jgi:hypothetical protein
MQALLRQMQKEMGPVDGQETRLFAPFIYKNYQFYQDRLGTNIGRTQKRTRFCRAG